jgi:L-fuconolactonase
MCKLSGMPSTTATGVDDLRPYYETVLEAFGAERLFFGTDWPVSTLAASYGEVCGLYRELTTDLTAVEQEAIFDRNARRVYGLQ